MPTTDDQADLLSELSDLDLVRHLLADLHDGLDGKIARFRQLADLTGVLGASGTMLFGGEITDAAWREAQWSFIHGNFAATVMLCQGLAEHLLASFLNSGLLIENLPKRISFAETLRRCLERKVISERDATDFKKLMDLRNPLSHFRDVNDEGSLSRRVLSTLIHAQEHLRGDATFAIGLAIRILALPAFRLGPSRRTKRGQANADE
jgi:hypothetical protein